MSNNLLFDGIVDVEIDYVPTLAISNVGKVSISGAQEKIFAVKDSNTYRLAQEGEQSTYIIKPRPNNPALMNQSVMPQRISASGGNRMISKVRWSNQLTRTSACLDNFLWHNPEYDAEDCCCLPRRDMDTLSFFLTAVVLLGIPTAKKNEENQ